MTIELNLDKNKKYVLGISGGPDSMALLSCCVEQGYSICVASSNYQLRDSAARDEKIVRDFCTRYHVPLYMLYPKQTGNENFQKWARDVRYDHYKEVYEKEKCDALLLGHQKDDSVENYLMALQRKSHGWYYGILPHSFVKGMEVFRPLLPYRKAQLRQYCLDHFVPFGDDESNFADKYTRNRIRHQLIEKADDAQFEKWVKEIDELNRRQDEKIAMAKLYIHQGELILSEYRNLPVDNRKIILRYLLFLDNEEKSYSEACIENIDHTLLCSSRNGFIDLYENHILVYEYDKVYICCRKTDYCYTLESAQAMSTPYFEIRSEGTVIEGITLQPADYPITIRNVQDGDEIALRFGHKKISRMFIDKKIPYRERIRLPVVTDKNGKIIFASRIGCDVDHYSIKPDVFMVELMY